MLLQTALRNKLIGAGRIAILGVGSEFRGDDACGVIVARKLKKDISSKKIKRVRVFLGHTAPENFTGQIKKFNPTHLIVFDALDLGKRPGSIAVIEGCNELGASFSTHRLPFDIIKDYLCKYITCRVIIVGIQPKYLQYNHPLSAQVQESVEKLSRQASNILQKIVV